MHRGWRTAATDPDPATGYPATRLPGYPATRRGRRVSDPQSWHPPNRSERIPCCVETRSPRARPPSRAWWPATSTRSSSPRGRSVAGFDAGRPALDASVRPHARRRQHFTAPGAPDLPRSRPAIGLA
ncbi:MAG: hypothetical protein MZW92_60275 [Comamonadaceae bacterium]|nr:hypothetical protein [Comamonadaceae bacterium]